jgi:hypothetical protein
MSWQVGDLALCVEAGRINCGCETVHNNTHSSLSKGATYRVRSIARACDVSERCAFCPCEALVTEDGRIGLSSRFRKVRPDAHEACEPEFVTLLKRAKRTVRA